MAEKLSSVSDINTAAFLSISGLAFSLENRNGKVFFTFTPSDELYKRLQDFNDGALVDVADYSRELRRLRARMYEVKGMK